MTNATVNQPFYLYDSVRLFFANGGVQCVIVSVGDYRTAVTANNLAAGLAALAQITQVTLIAMPEATICHESHRLEASALAQCAERPNRFAVFDLRLSHDATEFALEAARFKQSLGSAHLPFGAAYGPWILVRFVRTLSLTQLVFKRKADDVEVAAESLTSDADMLALLADIRALTQVNASADTQTLSQSLHATLFQQFALGKQWLDAATLALNTLPASGAVLGAYVATDQTRGVWKVAANVALQQVMQPLFKLSNAEQANYNIDAESGKSINLIRAFTGKGTLIWGARTLAGNDNEWRYIPVRRLFSHTEAAISAGLAQLVFEPNTAQTWARAQHMTEQLLTWLWRQGALQGRKPAQAFFVHIGLGKSMTENDIANSQMVIRLGMAAIRPAEFIILSLKQTQAG
ncbi:phage tail sheath family protein [Methylophilus medardicus]|uniref:phage tail sheath family protein n=1 Tax=Methylophilus medardicus TaxID=2588534 RepID=UPI001CB9AF5B|nr:phage tail sheath C-terminal domain-containing protein [Methylophilus medardicus]